MHSDSVGNVPYAKKIHWEMEDPSLVILPVLINSGPLPFPTITLIPPPQRFRYVSLSWFQ